MVCSVKACKSMRLALGESGGLKCTTINSGIYNVKGCTESKCSV